MHHVSLPVVSVIVPCYNASTYIDEALESLRTQTLRDIEILIVDDSSSDDSVARINRHAGQDSRVRLMTSDRPSGSASAPRNRGLSSARGEYVAFLDADDIALPCRLERTINAMRQTDAAVAFADFAQFSESEPGKSGVGFLHKSKYLDRAAQYYRPAGRDIWLTDDSIVGFMLGDMMGMNVQTFVAKRSAISNLGAHFDESLVGGEDLELFLRLASAHSSIYISEVLTRMRLSKGSLTARRYLECLSDSVSVKHQYSSRWSSRITRKELTKIRRAIAHQYLDLGYAYRRQGEAVRARVYCKTAWELRPRPKVALEYAKTFFGRTTQ